MEWVDEGGFLEGPVVLTNTHSVGTARDAVIKWRIAHGAPDATGYWWSLPVVAETYDGYLNDVNGFHVKDENVFHALDSAAPGPIAEGSVGGGTGMICYEFKGGTGTASRKLDAKDGGYTVGVLVQANCGLRKQLTIAGVPVGREITVPPVWKRGNRLDHHRRGHGRPAAPAPTQADRPPCDDWPGAHREHLGQRLGRHLPGVLHGEPRRRQGGGDHEAGHGAERRDQSAVRGDGAGHRGSHHQRPGRRRTDDRARRAPRSRRFRTRKCGRSSASTDA